MQLTLGYEVRKAAYTFSNLIPKSKWDIGLLIDTDYYQECGLNDWGDDNDYFAKFDDGDDGNYYDMNTMYINIHSYTPIIIVVIITTISVTNS